MMISNNDELYFRPRSNERKLSEIGYQSKQIDSVKNNKQLQSFRQYIFLLDFDDTMFPSSYFIQNISCKMDNSSGKILTFQIEEDKKTEFISNLQNVANSTLQLLNKLFFHVNSRQIKIVTNSAIGWVYDALTMAATFVKTYKVIKDLLIYNKIEIMYARNYDLKKEKCYDLILSQFNLNKKYNIIISIGDQWADHSSVKQSLLFSMFKPNIFHHQIKFIESPDC
eukprot:376684_1